MDISPDDSSRLEEWLEELFGERVSIEGGERRQLGNAELSIVEMGYTQEHRSTDGPTTHTHVRQTALVSRDPDLELPQFALSPTVKGFAGRLLSLFGDMGDINFPDSPQFSDEYHLHGWSERPVRLLFTPSLRDHFARNLGWNVVGKGNLLVIFRHNQVVDDGDHERFVQDSLKALSLFQQAEEQLDSMPEVRREATPSDMTATAERMGLAGALLAKELRKLSVTPDELDAFAAQIPPRDIPPGIWRQVLGNNLVVAIAGAMFTIAGLVGGTLILATADGVPRLLGLPFLILFPLMGTAMMFFTLRHRIRKRRTLRDGTLAEARVTRVKRTSDSVNDQRRYEVSMEVSQDVEQQSKTLNAYGPGVERARKFEASGEPMRILVDPRDPDHVVGLDLLLIFDE